MSKTIDERYKKAVQVINKAGGTPVPVSDNTIAILKHIVEEEHLDFIMAFKGKRSQTIDQMKEVTGLTEDEINKIFTKFGKIERYGKGLEFLDIQGSGLGLYISKEIIELHGGHISVESTGRNMGAKFTIELPIE